MVPGAGQLLNEQQQALPPAQNQAPAPALELPESPQRKHRSASTFKIRLAHLRFVGNHHLRDADLLRAASLEESGEYTLADLQEAADRITALYKSRGFLLARAYIGAQEMRNGELTLSVQEGELGEIHLDNRSRLSSDRLLGLLRSELIPGQPIRSDAANRALLLVQQAPGTQDVQASLSPGQVRGTSDLTVTASRARLLSAQLGLDNADNSYSGSWRLTGSLALDGLGGLGDRLALDGAVGLQDRINYVHAAWEWPLGNRGLRFGAQASNSEYHLGGLFSSLDAHGNALQGGLYARYPLWLAPQAHADLQLGVDRHWLEDVTGAASLTNDKRDDTLSLSLSGGLTETWLGQLAIDTFRVAGEEGTLRLQTASILASDRLSAKTDGEFRKLDLSVSREQQLARRVSLYLSLTSQFSSRNLDGSEKLSFGGLGGIRAFPAGEAIGDEGWINTNELRVNLLQRLQWTAFYEHGMSRSNRSPFTEKVPNNRHLAGFGTGFNASLASMTVAASAAWRVTGPATSDIDHRPRLWLQAFNSF